MILVRALILQKGEIHQFGDHVGPVFSSAVVNLLLTEGLGAVIWAEMGLIFWKRLSSDLGTPVTGGVKDAGREKAE